MREEKPNRVEGAVYEPSRKRRLQRKIVEAYFDSAEKPPKAAVKIAYYLDSLFIKNKIQKVAVSFRRKLAIPEDGLELDKQSLDFLLAKQLTFFHRKVMEKKVRGKKIYKSLQKIKDEIPFLDYRTKESAINLFLFYNAYDPEFFSHFPSLQSYNFFKTVDSKEEMSEFSEIKDHYFEFLEAESELYPIQVRISPLAGYNDFKEYFKNNWKIIEKEYKKYLDSKYTEIRNKSDRNFHIRDRNMLAFENKHLKHSKIHSLLVQEYGGDQPGEGEIAKFISLERKRRK